MPGFQNENNFYLNVCHQFVHQNHQICDLTSKISNEQGNLSSDSSAAIF
jgi:hypothetical protein